MHGDVDATDYTDEGEPMDEVAYEALQAQMQAECDAELDALRALAAWHAARDQAEWERIANQPY